MSQLPPSDKPRLGGHEAEGKVAALAAWALFVLSIPSANLLVLVGLLVAYAARSSAVGIPRAHIEAQISLFWSVFWWTAACWLLIAVSGVFSLILVGIPFLLLFLLLWFLISVWFTIKSILGLMNLLGDKAP